MRNRQAGMLFIFINLVLDITGIGLIIPILPELVRSLVGGSQSEAAQYYGAIVASYALMQFVFAPFLGVLSDRVGRRPVLLISIFGSGVAYVVLALAPGIIWLFVGRIIAGIMGASLTTANAYIADVSTPENRAQNFGLVGAAFGLGFIIGPALGGVLGAVDPRLPFWVAAGLNLINCLYGVFVLPESLKPEHRSRFAWRRANPVGSFVFLRKYPIVAGLAVVFLFLNLSLLGLQTVWVLFTSYRFGWGELTIGLTLAYVGLMAAVVQGGLIRLIIPKLGERRAIIMGLSFSVVTFAAYSVIWEGWMMLIVVTLGAMGGITAPALQGLIAGTVAPSEQGKVQGALTAILSLCAIVSPLIFTSGLFAYFTSERAPIVLPGAPFMLGTILNSIALIMVIRLFRRIPAEPLPQVAVGAATD
jgi:DHA1 family tetracycline resistance protein-like MFS transporter